MLSLDIYLCDDSDGAAKGKGQKANGKAVNFES